MLAHVYSFSTETREKLMSKMSDIFGEHKATAGFAGIFVISGSIMIGTAWSQAASYDRDPCASHSEAAAKPAETRPAATGTVTTPAANKEPKATKPTTVISVGPSASVVFGAPICVIVDGLSAMTIDKDHPLVLFLNGEPMSSVQGRVEDASKQAVLFRLDRKADDAERWSRLIGAPPLSGEVSLKVSVGAPDGAPQPRAEAAAITFLVFNQWGFWSGLVAFAAAVGMLIIAGAKTALLRDGDETSTFSLARCQMAWWLCLVTASFVYIWLVTGQISGVLTSDALILLGISGATGLAAVLIPTPQPTPQQPTPQQQAPQQQGQLSQGQEKTGIARFLHDLLHSEVKGGKETPQLHRIQMLLWTIILGFAFIWEVYSGFRMPKFDPNLLIMMGISGSLYLGFKFQET
jgi:hypothetical protein